jgi:hypothetical protein
MKTFIKNVILFGCLVFAMALSVQILLSLRMKGKSIKGYDNLEQTANVNADILLMGSSRCWAHLNPRFFEEAFKMKTVNIGVDGHTEIAMNTLRLKDYLSRNRAPKYILLNVDPFIAAGEENNNVNLVHKDAYARYSFLPKSKDLPIVDFFKFNAAEKYIPLYAIFKYKLLTDCLTLNHASNYVKYGYEVHEEAWDTIAKPVTGIMKSSFFPKKDASLISNAMAGFKQFCGQKNIKLICIETPIYKSAYDDDAFSRIRSIITKLGIPYVNTNNEAFRNHIEYFYNSNHMNKKGVLEMNNYLKTDQLLDSLLVRKQKKHNQ